MPVKVDNNKTPETKNYTVTEKAGIYVAGKRSPGKGKPIKLTAAQAETPLRNGEVSDPSAKPVDAKKKLSETT